MSSIHGVIIVNKPPGLSSSDACQRVKRLLRLRKVGHLGTLDPLATGVLPLCINEGTKLVQFLMHGDKEYVATMQLGIATDTQDSQGKVVSRSDAIPRDRDLILQAIEQFRGQILQMPPMFSALKHNGVPLYKIARKGSEVPREQRRVTIYEIEAIAIDPPQVTLRVVCSHGTYVRTICHDIGSRLGCGAHLVSLHRVRNGAFHIREALSLDDVAACRAEDLCEKHLISSRQALNGLPEVTVTSAVEQKIRSGMQVALRDVSADGCRAMCSGQKIKVLSAAGDLIGVVESLVDTATEPDWTSATRAWKTIRVFIN